MYQRAQLPGLLAHGDHGTRHYNGNQPHYRPFRNLPSLSLSLFTSLVLSARGARGLFVRPSVRRSPPSRAQAYVILLFCRRLSTSISFFVPSNGSIEWYTSHPTALSLGIDEICDNVGVHYEMLYLSRESLTTIFKTDPFI